ncbi:hypothetical protein [uncultured Paraglaciecola sp.]|uniref:hypothetical protein n=1 Tax=uncultured Paraglaciecola sp. TaxID=1765024 RepID=UPI002597A35E|nr:hypothetical protein [uncultured Paraglaciecola sp.]
MNKIILFLTINLISLDIYAATSKKCPGEDGYLFTNHRKTNPTKGGFVGNGAYVSEEAFIAPTASVCGSATVESGVRLMGNSIVKDEAIVEGKVRVMGNAIIGGTAMVSGSGSATIIKGYARIVKGEITSGKHGSNQMPDDVKQAQINGLKKQQQKEKFDKARADIEKLSENILEFESTGEGRIRTRSEGIFRVHDNCKLEAYWKYDYNSYESYGDRDIFYEVEDYLLKSNKFELVYFRGSEYMQLYNLTDERFAYQKTKVPSLLYDSGWKKTDGKENNFLFPKGTVNYYSAKEFMENFLVVAKFCKFSFLVKGEDR